MAPVPGYIAEEAWWDSPVDSEDEEKPLHTQATAAEKMRDMGSFTKYFHTIACSSIHTSEMNLTRLEI